MNNKTTKTKDQVAELMDSMTELHESDLDSIAGAMMSDCPKWPNTSKSWGF